jgi:hypothetical protein
MYDPNFAVVPRSDPYLQVIVLGTGLTECILSGLLVRRGQEGPPHGQKRLLWR